MEKYVANRNIFRVTKFSRRQFLKRAGIAAAGAAFTSIALASGCKSSSSTIAATTSVNPTTGGPVTSVAPSSSTPASSPSSPASTTPASSSSLPTSTTPAMSTTVTAGYSYIPPTVLPPLITVTGTTCIVATDRLYSTNNIWVKTLSTNIIVMGISATMVEIIYQPYSLSLSPVGTVFANGDDFGSLEGYKLSSDLISPVSGTILEINSPLINTKGVIISAINDDPYNAGWLVVVQLSDVSELNALMSPQSYSYLVQGEGLQTNGPV